MREIISIHIGQTGIQTGNLCWELFCLEHNIGSNGQLKSDTDIFKGNDEYRSIFDENSVGKYIPRSVHIDLEPESIDELLTGPYKELFDHNTFVCGKENTGGNYARAYSTLGDRYIDMAVDKIRKVADNCNDLQGFLIYNSVGGGTGSGFGSLLLERLSVDYEKKTKLGLTIYPSSNTSNNVLDPYNTILATHHHLEYTDVNMVFDNEALHRICRRNLDIERPSFLNMNRLTAQVVSSITSSIRYDGALNIDLKEFETNFVPYPTIHFLLTSYSPILPISKEGLFNPCIFDITNEATEPCSFLANCDARHGKYMAMAWMYRGDVAPSKVPCAALKTKRTIQFVDWCPTGIKCGLNYQPSPYFPLGDTAKVERSICIISNSTAIEQLFSKELFRFKLMYSKRAYVHWFLKEDFEEIQFEEASDRLHYLIQDYKEIEEG